jgi:hypothetical protein
MLFLLEFLVLWEDQPPHRHLTATSPPKTCVLLTTTQQKTNTFLGLQGYPGLDLETLQNHRKQHRGTSKPRRDENARKRRPVLGRGLYKDTPGSI